MKKQVIMVLMLIIFGFGEVNAELSGDVKMRLYRVLDGFYHEVYQKDRETQKDIYNNILLQLDILKNKYSEGIKNDIILYIGNSIKSDLSHLSTDNKCLQKNKNYGMCEAVMGGVEFNQEANLCEWKSMSGCGGYSPFFTIEDCKKECIF